MLNRETEERGCREVRNRGRRKGKADGGEKKGGNRDRGRLRGEMKSGDVGGRGAEKRGTEGG